MVNTISALLISMIFMASLSSISHALVLNGLLINAVQVTGVLHCSLNGNLNAPPLIGVTVHLVCDGSSTDLAQAVTDQSGAFNIMLRLQSLTNFDLQRCSIRVNLPVASCSIFPSTGFLTGSLGLLRVIQSTLGNVACLVFSGPIRINL